jgi:hypothetical protein
VSAEVLLWVAIGAALWAAGLVAVIALGAAAKRGDEQLDAQYDALRTEDATATARPATSAEVLSEACRVLGAARGALLVAGDTAGTPRVLARHSRPEIPEHGDVDLHVVASALTGEEIIVAHTTPLIDAPERWAIKALAVPVRQPGANRGVLYLDGFADARTLGPSDRRFLVECATRAAPLMEPRFTRAPATAVRRQPRPAAASQGPADAGGSDPSTAP